MASDSAWPAAPAPDVASVLFRLPRGMSVRHFDPRREPLGQFKHQGRGRILRGEMRGGVKGCAPARPLCFHLPPGHIFLSVPGAPVYVLLPRAFSPIQILLTVSALVPDLLTLHSACGHIAFLPMGLRRHALFFIRTLWRLAHGHFLLRRAVDWSVHDCDRHSIARAVKARLAYDRSDAASPVDRPRSAWSLRAAARSVPATPGPS